MRDCVQGVFLYPLTIVINIGQVFEKRNVESDILSGIFLIIEILMALTDRIHCYAIVSQTAGIKGRLAVAAAAAI
jgi:hypothetical protein